MNIPWKIKSFIFSVIDNFNATKLLYFLQKNVTKRSRINDLQISPIWQKHKRNLIEHQALDFVFEFGAGKSLAQNLFLSDAVTRQMVVDLNPMIEMRLVNSACKQISKLVPLRSDREINSLNDLAQYGIQYRSPYDAANIDLPDGTLSACISTNTLEHIPGCSLHRIFTELYRTLKVGGIASLHIDYSDHYAHTDKAISLLNYLKFDDKTWRKYNHRCHYQNRLRHYDYVKTFKDIGFDIVGEELFYGEGNPPDDVLVAFKDKEGEWKATAGYFLLKKGVDTALLNE